MHDMREGTCPLCNHHEVIEAIPIDLTEKDHKRQSVTYESERLGSGDPIPGTLRLHQAYGALTYYVCRKCGFVQWFAESPEKIPIGKHTRTRMRRGKPAEVKSEGGKSGR
jgi:rubrerythrin